MPRSHVPVKRFLTTPGLIDLHFHGAFGIDLISASLADLQNLSLKLGQNGIAGFCPTTLSAPLHELLPTVERLGKWIRQHQNQPGHALPLGIHLEGPFIHPEANGAHPPSAILPFEMKSLLKIWEASQKTLKILTVAPDRVTREQIRQLANWCNKNQVHLSAGHTLISQSDAVQAFNLGFQGVTHSWNAMKFHHRDPGLLGAAVGRKNTWIELIVDQAHVDRTVIRWMTRLHAHGLCWVSDCAPAAALRSAQLKVSFGPHLKVHRENSLCKTQSGQIAGGGALLTDSYKAWLKAENESQKTPIAKLFKTSLPWITRYPLQALRLKIPSKKLPVHLDWDLKTLNFKTKSFD